MFANPRVETFSKILLNGAVAGMGLFLVILAVRSFLDDMGREDAEMASQGQ